MSSAMVHLSCAKKVDANAPVLFYTGNIAPDMIGAREEKDRTHFRGISDRFGALHRFAEGLDLSDPFSRGVLLHLFLDLHWDREGYDVYGAAHASDPGWFFQYRREIFLAGSYLYHHDPDAPALFLEMSRTFLPLEPQTPFPCGITRDGLQSFVSRTWYPMLNAREAYSEAFPPDFVEQFTDFVAAEFQKTFGNA